MKLFYLLGAAVLALPLTARAQSVGIGTTTPDPTAALDISSSGKGLLIPRLDSASRAAIASPPTGLMVFQTDGRTGFWYAAGGTWLYLPDKTRSGDNLGNHTATQNLNLGTNRLVGNGGSQGLVVGSTGNVGVGVAAPAFRLEVNGGVGVNGNLSLANASVLQTGNAVSGRQADAGKIGYGTLSGGTALDIAGAGTTVATRRVKLWAEGGTELTGPLKINTLTTAGLVTTDASGNLTSQPAAALDPTTATNGLTKTGSAFGLGGTLGQATDLNTGAYPLRIGPPTAAAPAVDQTTLAAPVAGSNLNGAIRFQTLTAGLSGNLTAVDLRLSYFFGTSSFTLNVRAGAGLGGAVLGSFGGSVSSSAATTVTVPTSGVALTAGQVYTLEITDADGRTSWSLSNNPYPGGVASVGATFDFLFQTTVVSVLAAPTALVVAGGQVGVGTAAPTVALDVAGNARLRGLTTAGLVTTDASGNLSSQPAAALDATTASNGLTQTGAALKLGGLLTENTTVNGGPNYALTLQSGGYNAATPGPGYTGSTTGFNTATGTPWQSFVIPATGYLQYITLTVNTSISEGGYVPAAALHQGTGLGGQQLKSWIGPDVPYSSTDKTATFLANIPVVAGQVITLALTTVSPGLPRDWTFTTAAGTTPGWTTEAGSGRRYAFSTTVATGADAHSLVLQGGRTTLSGLANTYTNGGVVMADADGTLSTRDLDLVADNLGSHTATTTLNLSDQELQLRPADTNHGLGYYGTPRTAWNGVNVDGPVLYGFGGGGLGSRTASTQTLALRWTAAGRVGIGTDAPDRPLTVQAASGSTQLLSLKDNAGATQWHWNLNTAAAPGLNLAESGVADFRLFVQDGGNVGIGTGTPNARLDVAGTAGTPNVRLQSLAGTGSRIVMADASGNLSASGQRGTFAVGSSTSALKVVTVTFPASFAAAPSQVICTVRTENGQTYTDTFSVTTKEISATGFKANILRTDNTALWGQALLLDWLALP